MSLSDVPSIVSDEIIEGLFLVCSNLALVPAIVVAFNRQLIPETTILICMILVSSIYHFCQAGFVCIWNFQTLQIWDHFTVYTTLMWMVLYFLGITTKQKVTFFMTYITLLIPLVLIYMHSWYLSIALLCGIGFISLVVMIFYLKGFPKCDWFDLFTAAVLIIGGFFFFIYSGDPGSRNYWWGHSLWHICAMFAIFFVIEIRDGTSWITELFGRKRKKKKSPILPVSKRKSPKVTIKRDGENMIMNYDNSNYINNVFTTTPSSMLRSKKTSGRSASLPLSSSLYPGGLESLIESSNPLTRLFNKGTADDDRRAMALYKKSDRHVSDV